MFVSLVFSDGGMHTSGACWVVLRSCWSSPSAEKRCSRSGWRIVCMSSGLGRRGSWRSSARSSTRRDQRSWGIL